MSNTMRLNKAIKFLFLSLIISCSLFGQAYAEVNDYSGPYLKLYGGLNIARDSEFNGSSPDSFPSGEASLDAGQAIGLAGGYRFNRNFAAELDYSYRSNDIDKILNSRDTQIANGSDLASVAIMANAYYFFDFAESWNPYLGLGLGFLQEIDADITFISAAGQKDLEDEAFAWQAMIGAEFPINENWRLFGEGRFMTAPGPELNNNNGYYDIDYENISFIAGISYQF